MCSAVIMGGSVKVCVSPRDGVLITETGIHERVLTCVHRYTEDNSERHQCGICDSDSKI